MKFPSFLVKKKVISREDGVPYLVRYSLLPFINSRYFGMKVHHILASDPSCLHDHPWAFISIILKGGYYEYQDVPNKSAAAYLFDGEPETIRQRKWYGAGSILFRRARTAHRLELAAGHFQGRELPEGGFEYSRYNKPAWTFVVTFKKVRPWGFLTGKGWIPWQRYNDTIGQCD